jgi:hypothetical protein
MTTQRNFWFVVATVLAAACGERSDSIPAGAVGGTNDDLPAALSSAAADSVPPAADAAARTAGESAAIRFGVLRSDGVVIPFAMYDAGAWTREWTEPFEESDAPPSPVGAPSVWYLLRPDETPLRLHAYAPRLTATRCEVNWGLPTDWPAQQAAPPSTARRVAGLVATVPIELLAGDELRELEELRRRTGPVGNDLDGEGRLRYEPLGYFSLGGPTGVFIAAGWEGEAYEVHRLEVGDAERLVRVRGGGC